MELTALNTCMDFLRYYARVRIGEPLFPSADDRYVISHVPDMDALQREGSPDFSYQTHTSNKSRAWHW